MEVIESNFNPVEVHYECGCVKPSNGDKEGLVEDTKKGSESNFKET